LPRLEPQGKPIRINSLAGASSLEHGRFRSFAGGEVAQRLDKEGIDLSAFREGAVCGSQRLEETADRAHTDFKAEAAAAAPLFRHDLGPKLG